MRVMLINPPYQTLTSNLGVGHQVPLGLLMVGGALADAGHTVRLLDAEALHLHDAHIVQEVRRWGTEVVMTGHAGSTPAHPVCVRMLRAIKATCPAVWTVYGGVYPTYHASQILRDEPAVDIIIRGEGEATAAALMHCLDEAPDMDRGAGLAEIEGLAYRAGGHIAQTGERLPIQNLDAWRVGWELIEDWDRYQCFGLGRAAIVQYSRGCPHRCTYCGQHGFWVSWRRRSVRSFVDEIEMLHRRHGVRFLTLADENPTTLRREWRELLEEIARRRLPVHLFVTIRASDIVRDEDILHLYREAGILYILMGIESTDDRVLRAVRKRSNSLIDYRACQLLKQHGIFSIIGHIVGLGDETSADFRRARRVLEQYDGDYLNAMYVTPHSWTQFAAEQSDRPVVQPDQRRWDYRHQVLAQQHMKPWRLLLAVKWLELCFHLRPRRIWRLMRADRFRRRQMLWCQWHTFKVWLGEIAEFFTLRYDTARARPLKRACELGDRRTPLQIRINIGGAGVVSTQLWLRADRVQK